MTDKKEKIAEDIKKLVREKERNRIIRSIDVQKWNLEGVDCMEELSWKTRENDAYDLCIKIVTNKRN